MSNVQVTRMHLNRSHDVVIVTFSDGHKATFVENRGGWSSSSAIERFFLEFQGRTVSDFHSQYQHPVNHTPFGFVHLADGYTPQRVAEYWQAAMDFADRAARQGRLTEVRRILIKGVRDLDDVKQGQWPTLLQQG